MNTPIQKKFKSEPKQWARNINCEIYKKIRSTDSMPDEECYLTLCNYQDINDIKTELGQMVNSKFIKEEQYFGVDKDREIINTNKKTNTKCTFIKGNIENVLNKFEETYKKLPLLIYADTQNIYGYTEINELIGNLLHYMKDKAILIVNGMCNNPYEHVKGKTSSFKNTLKDMGHSIPTNTLEKIHGTIISYKYSATPYTNMETVIFTKNKDVNMDEIKKFIEHQLNDIDDSHIQRKYISKSEENYEIPKPKDPKYKELLPLQEKVYKQLKDNRFTVTCGPCGSGKTFLHVALATHEVIKNNGKRKCLIVVPQKDIAHGFCNDVSSGLSFFSFKIDNEKFQFKPNNICDENSKKIEQLKDWLLEDPIFENDLYTIKNNVTLCTHMALCLCWNKLSEENKIKIRNNCSIRVDEGHHVKGISEKEENESYESNILGKIGNYYMKDDKHCAGIHFTSATLYRGDKCSIISQETSKKFTVGTIPFLEHWKTLGIENLTINFKEYDNENPFDEIANEISKDKSNEKRHLVTMVPTGSEGRERFDDYKKLINKIKEKSPEKIILDLIDKNEETIKTNYSALDKEPKRIEDGQSKIHVVAACNRLREGKDWVPCSDIHNFGMSSSLTKEIQTIGRALRRFEGKKEVIINYYIKSLNNKKYNKRDVLSDRLNALLLFVQWDDLFCPILVPKIKKIKNTNHNNSLYPSKDYSLLTDYFENDEQYNRIKNEIISFATMKDYVPSEEIIRKKIEEILNSEKLYQENNDDNKDAVENIKDGFLRLIIRTKFSDKIDDIGKNISFLRKDYNFDKLNQNKNNKKLFFCNVKDKYFLNILKCWKKYVAKNQEAVVDGMKKFLKDQSESALIESMTKGSSEKIAKLRYNFIIDFENGKIHDKVKKDLNLYISNYKTLFPGMKEAYENKVNKEKAYKENYKKLK